MPPNGSRLRLRATRGLAQGPCAQRATLRFPSDLRAVLRGRRAQAAAEPPPRRPQWYLYQTFQPERNLLTNAWPWDRLADGSNFGNRTSTTQVLAPTVLPHR